MDFVVAVTDNKWFAYLRARQSTEVNFWSRKSTADVKQDVGTLWLFKLHAPMDFVVGGGYFVQRTVLPLRIAWDTFEEENGAPTYDEFRALIGKDSPSDPVGCTVLCEAFYWPEDLWLPAPPTFSKNTQRYVAFSVDDPRLERYWAAVQERLPQAVTISPSMEPAAAALGKPSLHIPRLGQGAFRSGIIDLYGRRCAITGERTLPALEAAHIVPFSEVKHHDLRNGLLLRADLHKLFDDGYVTVDRGYRIHVSRKIKEEFENGRDYYAFHGRELRLPADLSRSPSPEYLDRHATGIFKE